MKANPSFRKAAAAILLVSVTVLFSSCRTTEGFGQDLQKLGNKIENEAEGRG